MYEDSDTFDVEAFNPVASLTYDRIINQTGWNYLKIYTYSKFTDDE